MRIFWKRPKSITYFLSPHQAIEVREKYAKGISTRQLAAEYKVPIGAMQNALTEVYLGKN